MDINNLGPSSFYSNLFGTIAGFQGAAFRNNQFPDIIPLDGSGNTMMLKDPGAIWWGLQLPLMQRKAYEFCYPLASVIDRLAEADISGDMEIYQMQGKGRDKVAVNEWSNVMRTRLDQPNPLQTWDQFRGQQNLYKRVFGYCPVLPVIPTGFENQPWYCSSLINIPPWCFDVVPTNKYLFETTLSGMIARYTVTLLGQSFNLGADEVMILEDSFHQDENKAFLLPKSRLVGLDMAVSNLCAAMEADNVLLKKKGPLGFIAHDAAAAKDSVAGYIPMDEEDVDELQQALQRYGMSWDQYQYVISRSPLRWNPMSFDVKGLGTKETILASARAICQRFGFPYVLFEDSDATYSNQASAHKKLYDDVILPANARDMKRYDKFFKAKENNCCLKCDYSHLGVFQEDELNRGKARAANAQGLEIEYLNDIITKNQWLGAIGEDPVQDGDLYYSQSAAKQAADQLAIQQTTITAANKLQGNGNQA